MKENCETNNHEQNKIYIPPKLPNSLAKKTCSPLWKKIVQAIENKDVETVFEFVKSIDRQQDILCLPHPFMDNIDTFPSKSVREGMCNFIFFHDKNEQYQWILCQCTSFVDAIFSETFSGKHKASTTENVILNAAKKVIRNEKKSEVRQLQHKGAIFSGYLLDQTRPYHHFYDQLKWLVNIKTKRAIVSNKSFFAPRHLTKRISSTKDVHSFSIFPLVIGSNQLGIKLDEYSEKMEEIVLKDSLRSMRGGIVKHRWNRVVQKIKRISKRDRTLTLWFGISGQKRIWMEQEDFLPNLVEQLEPWFDSFVFLIDGFTQYEYTNSSAQEVPESTGISQDRDIVRSIKKKLLPFPNTSVINLVGQTYRKKIQHCQSIDFFIANAGAGQLIPHRFCKKSGILHSNEKHCVFSMGINNTTVKLVDKSLVEDVGNLFAKGKNKKANTKGVGFISYSINIQTVINMVKEMLHLHEQKIDPR